MLLRHIVGGVLLIALLGSVGALAQDKADGLAICDDQTSISGAAWCWRINGSVEAGMAVDIADGELFATLISASGASLVNHGVDDGVSSVVSRLTTEAHIVVSTQAMTEWGLALGVIEMALSREATQSATIEQAYVRLGAVTAGLAPSIFDFSTGYAHTDGIASDQKVSQVSVALVSGPASLAIAVEDAETRSATSETWGKRGGTAWPDLVARARYSGDFGLFQAMAALRELSPAETDVDRGVGYAWGAGIELRADSLVPGARILASGVVSSGALTYSGAREFATDFFVDDGALHATDAASYLISALLPVGRKSTLAASFSHQSTDTEGSDLTWWTDTTIASATASTVLVPGLLAGFDASYIRDETRDRTLGVDGAAVSAERVVLTGFLKRRF